MAPPSLEARKGASCLLHLSGVTQAFGITYCGESEQQKGKHGPCGFLIPFGSAGSAYPSHSLAMGLTLASLWLKSNLATLHKPGPSVR